MGHACHLIIPAILRSTVRGLSTGKVTLPFQHRA